MFGLTPWRKETRPREGALTRRREYPVDLMREEFDNLFNRFFGNWPAAFEGWGWPSAWHLDLEDNGKEWVVRAEAPGFEAQDFDVQVAGDWLTVRAERKQETEGKEGEAYQERHYRRFERSVALPAGTDKDKVEARYRNGVLEVHLPKTPEAQGKRIEVKS
jgi:HSP20 family protein